MSNNKSNKLSKKLSKDIYLSVSQLYIITGLDRFGKLCPLLIKYWEKVFPKDYYQCLYDIQDVYPVEHINETFLQSVQRLSKKYNLDIMKQIKLCMNSGNLSEMTKIQSNIITRIEKSQIDKKDKNLLVKNVKCLTNTNYGTAQEGGAIDNYCKKLNVEVSSQQKFFKRKIAEVDNYNWYLCGSIDGISSNGTLVEIKNRVHKLFETLRDYEKPQIQAYLKLTNMQNGHLVEYLKKNNNMNVIEVQRDNKYWKEFILPNIEKFINFLYHFIKRPEMKFMVLMNQEDEIGKYYKKFLL